MPYCEFLVDIPSVQGKIVRKKQSGKIFIQLETGRIYNPERKNTTPERVTIGKVSEEDENKMHPNDSFFIHFPSVAIPALRPEGKRSCCLKIGAYIAIKKVIKELELDKILTGVFKKDNASLILDLAAYCIVSEDNATQYYPDYNYNHALFTAGMHMYSDSSVSRLFASIDSSGIQKALNKWNGRMDKKERIYISYDSTNKNTQIGDLEIAEFGHAKDNKGLPVFNFSVAYDQSNSIPLFYENYPGSIVDAAQLKYTIDKAIGYGYRKMGVILDRGYFTRECLQYIVKNGFSYLAMIKGQKRLVSSIIKEKAGTFEGKNRYYIPQFNAYGITVEHKLFASDDYNSFIHIYYNESRAAGERRKFLDGIEELYRFLNNEAAGRPYEKQASIERYFNVVLNTEGNVLFAEERDDEIDEATSLMGYFGIVTSESMSAEEALSIYKSRDASEKLFRADKTFLGARSERTHSDENTRSKIFVEFIALIIRSRIFTLLREAVLNNNIKDNFMTVPAAMKELEKIESVMTSNKQYMLDHAVTKTQKTILSAFGLTEADVREEAAEIKEILAGSKGLPSIVEKEDNEYGKDEEY